MNGPMSRQRAAWLWMVALAVIALPAVGAPGTSDPYLVKDVRSGSASSRPQELTDAGGVLFYQANDGISGAELWRSDGTAGGTYRVKDINPGTLSSMPREMVAVGGTVFFTATTGAPGSYGHSFWRSDGTSAGTVMVKNRRPYELTNVNGTLFFRGKELWRSNGTEISTVQVKDIRPGSAGSYPSHLTNVGGVLFCVADDGTHGRELWRSDGTATGTYMVRDIRSGSSSGVPLYSRSVFAILNGTLFFAANDGVHGWELWKSDGSNVGTVMVKDVRTGSASSFDPSYSLEFIELGGSALFWCNDGVHGRELWKTDGTATGTVLVKDIWPGAYGSFPHYFAKVQGTVFFTASAPGYGYELWKTDGSADGTVMVKDIYTGTSWNGSGIAYLTPVGKTLYFSANDQIHGRELWQSDGTETGTSMVKDIRPGYGSGLPYGGYPQSLIANVGGSLFFSANNGVAGLELWAIEALTPAERLARLIEDVEDLTFGAGLTNSLVSKLEGALSRLEDANESDDVAAIKLLGAFVNEVEAQSGKAVSASEADALAAAAEEILSELE